MKVQLSLLALLALMLFFPACLPEDEDIDTGDPVEKFLGTWSVNESCRRGNYYLRAVAGIPRNLQGVIASSA